MAIPAAPVTPKKEHTVSAPAGARQDPYYWLRDDSRSQPEILAQLQKERDYFDAVSAGYAPLTQALTQEVIARVKQDDSTVPYKDRDYRYSARYAEGQEYPIYVRTPVAGGAEQLLIDGNIEAKGKAYYKLSQYAVSPDQQLLAYTEDSMGRFQNTLRVRDLRSGKNLPDAIPGLSGEVVWAKDSRSLFYVENDPKTLLSVRVKRHVLGSDPQTDPLVYEEKDHSFYLGLGQTGDERYILLNLDSTITGEVLVIAADHPEQKPKTLGGRKTGIQYDADHIAGRFVIRTDWNAPNYRVMSVADEQIGKREAWTDLVAHDKARFIEAFALFKNFLVIEERAEALLRLRAIPWDQPEKSMLIASDEPAYTASLDENAEQDTDTLRYSYSSLTTPNSVYDVDMGTGKRQLLKEQPVLGGFDKTNYRTERLWATASDGTKIPVSLVYRKGFKKDGKAPLYQYAYGSYGISMDAYFRGTVLSLLDRGFVFAIAHIRGGQEMGRQWYEDGKLLKKKNSFTDFIAVTDFLVAEHYAAKDKVFAAGGSAGGLLVGAVANMAGEKYRGLIAHVPFVDIVTTMLDESIPLTTNEFDEWGNPQQKKFYEYMLSYSPYDNVAKKPYPAMLITTGLHDSQVQYFEPAKWVARLRELKTDQNPLLFKINLEAGHGGKSGRFQRLEEAAEEYAFILHTLGMEH